MMEYRTPEAIPFELSVPEALVLDEFLHRWETTNTLSIDYAAEWLVLSKIKGILESNLVEPFHDRYLDFLEQARVEVVGDTKDLEIN